MYCDEYPKIVWVRMLKRPSSESFMPHHKIFGLHGKFNSILEERLMDGFHDHHRIMSNVVPPDGFNGWGDLTPSGKSSFWSKVDAGMKKFDKSHITLLLCNFKKGQQSHINTNSSTTKPLQNPGDQSGFMASALASHKENKKCYKLKTPPLRRHLDQKTKRTRSRSCRRSRNRSHSHSRDHKYRKHTG